MRYRLLLLLGVFCFQVSAEDIKAITTDGKSVLLHENGKWSFEENKVFEKDGFNFRKTKWGMSKEEVIKSENLEIQREKDNTLVYFSSLSGTKVVIGYVFSDNKLTRAKYGFIEEHTNTNDYLMDFSSVQETVTNKYGDPTKVNDYWSQDTFKDKYQQWGLAVSVGHLSKYVTWETSDTTIIASLSGDNYEIRHSIEYSSKNLIHLERAEREKRKADDF